MSTAIIYSTNYCPYCVKAKTLLDELGIQYEEINIETNPEKRDEMLVKSGGMRTVPQIFIKNVHVGGCDDLYASHNSGELAKILEDE